MFGSSAMESYFREIVVSIRRNAGHSFFGVAYRQARHKMLWREGRARYVSFAQTIIGIPRRFYSKPRHLTLRLTFISG